MKAKGTVPNSSPNPQVKANFDRALGPIQRLIALMEKKGEQWYTAQEALRKLRDQIDEAIHANSCRNPHLPARYYNLSVEALDTLYDLGQIDTLKSVAERLLSVTGHKSSSSGPEGVHHRSILSVFDEIWSSAEDGSKPAQSALADIEQRIIEAAADLIPF